MERSNLTNDAFVSKTLNCLELNFRIICLSMLDEIYASGIITKSLYSEIAGLQRPSWGCWNGFLNGVLKARRLILNTDSEQQRELMKKSSKLIFISTFMEIREKILDYSFLEKCYANGFLMYNKSNEDNILFKELLSIPIQIRNRVVHDNIEDQKWWNDVSYILEYILNWQLKSNIEVHFNLSDVKAPWLLRSEGECWFYNGIESKGSVSSVVYISENGKSRQCNDMSGEVMLAFRKILGEERLQESNFKKLLNKLAPEELKGFILGGYIVGEKAGEGGFAEVYKGIQLSTGRKVAIKILKKDLSESDRQRFIQEAKFLSRFDHPNITKIYEQNEQPWSVSKLYDIRNESWYSSFKKTHAEILTFIAMEWIDGRTIDAVYSEIVSNEKSYREKEIARWFMEAAQALEVIHNANIIHRDISPKNLMITDDGTIKLMDFGISRAGVENRTILTAADTILGSEAYMSPEQLVYKRAVAELDHKSDIYSLGATFYELFTRSRIYNHNNNINLIKTASKLKQEGKSPKRPVELNKSLSWEICTILMGCLQNEKADRYVSAKLLKEDIINYLNDRPIEYKKPKLRRRMYLAYRRNFLVANVTVAFIAVIIVLTGIYINSIISERNRVTQLNVRLQDQIIETEKQSKNAEYQKGLAQQNEKTANKNAEEARANAKEAKDNADEAKRNAAEAEKQRNEAIFQATVAEKQRKEAENQTIIANIQRKKADAEAEKARKQKEIALGMIERFTNDYFPVLNDIPNTKKVLTDMLDSNAKDIDRIVKLEPNTPEGKPDKINVLLLLSNTWMLAGDTEKAKNAVAQSLKLSNELADEGLNKDAKWYLADSYHFMGYIKAQQGDLKGALDAYSKDFEICRDLAGNSNDKKAQLYLYTSSDFIALMKAQQGDLDGAMDLYELCIELTKKLAEDKSNADAQWALASCYDSIALLKQQQGKLDEALKLHMQSLEINKELAANRDYKNGQFYLSSSYIHVGGVKQLQGKLDEALAAYTQSLDIRKELAKDKTNTQMQTCLAQTYDSIGWIKQKQAKIDEALEAYTNSYKISKMLAEDKSNADAQRKLAGSIYNIGKLKYQKGDFKGALEAYLQDLDIKKELDTASGSAMDQMELAYSYNSVGLVKLNLGDLDGALESYANSTNIGKKFVKYSGVSNSKTLLVSNYKAIALIDMKKGDLDGALQANENNVNLLSQTAKDLKNISALKDLGASYASVGYIKQLKGDLKGALEAYEKVNELLSYFVKTNNDLQSKEDMITCYNLIADLKAKLGDSKGSEEAKALSEKIKMSINDS